MAGMSRQFLQIVGTTCGTGVVLLLIARPVKRMMRGVE
jgi:hypothetical protein